VAPLGMGLFIPPRVPKGSFCNIPVIILVSAVRRSWGAQPTLTKAKNFHAPSVESSRRRHPPASAKKGRGGSSSEAAFRCASLSRIHRQSPAPFPPESFARGRLTPREVEDEDCTQPRPDKTTLPGDEFLSEPAAARWTRPGRSRRHPKSFLLPLPPARPVGGHRAVPERLRRRRRSKKVYRLTNTTLIPGLEALFETLQVFGSNLAQPFVEGIRL